MITASDRVSAVLAKDERLIEVFESLSPAFKLLRNPLRRKTMAKLVTLSQAARIAGVDVDELVLRLNHALGVGFGEAPRPLAESPGAPAESRPAPPPGLLQTPADQLVELDVRAALQAGEEPLKQILAAAKALPEGHVLRLRAPFEPVPLFDLLAKRGLAHYAEPLGQEDWRVWFYASGASSSARTAEPAPGAAGAATGSAAGPLPGDLDEGDVVIVDVRGLEPPEPLERTLTALASLPHGKVLVQLNERVPRFLLPRLEERGFSYTVHEAPPGLVRIFIRHAT